MSGASRPPFFWLFLVIRRAAFALLVVLVFWARSVGHDDQPSSVAPQETVAPQWNALPQDAPVIPPPEAAQGANASPWWTTAVVPTLIALPWLTLAVWMFFQWRQRAVWLQRQRDVVAASLDTNLSDKLMDDSSLFTGHSLRTVAREFRFHEQRTSQRLDVKRTIAATVRTAGLFCPILQEHSVNPEYLILIEQFHADDHLARLIDVLMDNLRREQVALDRYYFRRDPRILQTDGRLRRLVDLSDLASRARSNAHLIVFGTADGIVDSVTGRALTWTSIFQSWSRRSFMTTRSQVEWGVVEATMHRLGFTVAAVSLGGLKAIAEASRGGSSPQILIDADW